jgi:hypothetical protein
MSERVLAAAVLERALKDMAWGWISAANDECRFWCALAGYDPAAFVAAAERHRAAYLRKRRQVTPGA